MSIYGGTLAKYTDENLNALASTYATDYSKTTTDLIKRSVHSIIYDIAPKQFYDMTILDSMPAETAPDTEFFFAVKTYSRYPLTVASPGVASPGANATQDIPTSDTTMCAVDNVVCYPDGTKGLITVVTLNTKVTVRPYTGGTLPAVTATQTLPILGPVEGDASDDIKTYFRLDIEERYNFVQQYVKAMKWGEVEIERYRRNGTFSNYLQMNRTEFFDQVRIDRSNFYWLGTRGELTIANGNKVKMAGGIYQTMIEMGTQQFSATSSTLASALEDAALSTNYKEYGAVRFLYATPRLCLAVSKAYKDTLTRYTPDSKVADLMLDMIKIGDSDIVLVPMKRFIDTASFPVSFQNKMFLIDQTSIIPMKFMAESYGTTLGRVNNGTLKKYSEEWVSMDFSQKFLNPLGCAIINYS